MEGVRFLWDAETTLLPGSAIVYNSNIISHHGIMLQENFKKKKKKRQTKTTYSYTVYIYTNKLIYYIQYIYKYMYVNNIAYIYIYIYKQTTYIAILFSVHTFTQTEILRQSLHLTPATLSRAVYGGTTAGPGGRFCGFRPGFSY